MLLDQIAQETGIAKHKISNTVELLDDDKTIPFIARYRKEVTGELDEVQIRKIDELLTFYRKLQQKKEDILRLINEQGKLTDELQEKISAASKMTELDDLYRPYRQERKTRASIARGKGLQGLANDLLSCPESGSIEELTKSYLNADVETVEEAIQGAKDIIAEQVADMPEVRGRVRDYMRRYGILQSKARQSEQDSLYRMYHDYEEAVGKIPPHRILAINRGEREEVLRVSIDMEADVICTWIIRQVGCSGITGDLLKEAIMDAYKRLLHPAVERDIRSELTQRAEQQALLVFSKNLRSLLLQSPVQGKVILGVDPAYRTGCKVAVVDATGRLLQVGVMYPTPPRNDIAGANRLMANLFEKHPIQAIVIGNGTGSRETEKFIADFLQNRNDPQLAYTIVSEAGASVYSASELAAEEFPDLDVSERSAISIARRIQDPLAELVKIEPRSCGVGQYQHDIAPKRLDESLKGVVESAVNYVGVDLNTASSSLLGYVSGINQKVAVNIIKYREDNGRFKTRKELRKVAKLGPKSFEQAAGFLRITGGENPLDATPIHPESYELTTMLLKLMGLDLKDIGTEEMSHRLKNMDVKQVASELGAGLPTLKDIVDSLLRPGRDPREDVPPPVFRKDVLSMEDLKAGMEFQGVVRNVVDFGVFVDIGVKTDGLVHISEMSEKRIAHPMDLVSLGDIVTVRVLLVEIEKHRISLTMKTC